MTRSTEVTNDGRITVLLPTRAREELLFASLDSIIQTAHDVRNLDVLLAFDRDDDVGIGYFKKHLQSWLESNAVTYTALLFDPVGYLNLNVYYNRLADQATTEWLMVWNDDAKMKTKGWDQCIGDHTGKFCLLRAKTHLDHPYSIFPIWPRQWHQLLGYSSQHAMIDAELSQNAYCLDIMQDIAIEIDHERWDISGKNRDSTLTKNIGAKSILEGDHNNPADINHITRRVQRHLDCDKLAAFMLSRDMDISFWQQVRQGQADPWGKLKQNDVNNMTYQIA